MQHRDNMERSAEYLRLAISHMAQQAAGLHPVSYAVWYEYVSGRNDALNRELEGYRSKGQKLSDETTLELYMKHVAELDQGTIDDAGSRLQRVIAEVTETAMRSHAQAKRYGEALERFGSELGGEAKNQTVERGVRTILEDTDTIKTSIGGLRQVLDSSRSEIEQLRLELSRARQEALVDALSGLLNRKGFDQSLESTIAWHAQEGSPISLLMIDIDHFKRVNDTYGHLFGDRVIRGIAQGIKNGIKGGDIASRFGGEEFAVILPNTRLEGALAVAEQLRAGISRARIRRIDRDEYVGNITISIGAACLEKGEGSTSLIGRADAALYAAKQQGRNRVAGS